MSGKENFGKPVKVLGERECSARTDGRDEALSLEYTQSLLHSILVLRQDGLVLLILHLKYISCILAKSILRILLVQTVCATSYRLSDSASGTSAGFRKARPMQPTGTGQWHAGT